MRTCKKPSSSSAIAAGLLSSITLSGTQIAAGPGSAIVVGAVACASSESVSTPDFASLGRTSIASSAMLAQRSLHASRSVSRRRSSSSKSFDGCARAVPDEKASAISVAIATADAVPGAFGRMLGGLSRPKLAARSSKNARPSNVRMRPTHSTRCQNGVRM
jgi:hypothetical protein